MAGAAEVGAELVWSSLAWVSAEVGVASVLEVATLSLGEREVVAVGAEGGAAGNPEWATEAAGREVSGAAAAAAVGRRSR